MPGLPGGAFVLAVLLQALLVMSCRSSTPGLGSGTDDEARQLRSKLAQAMRAEQVLSAEYSLARNPAPYLVLGLAARTIELKARGRTLRNFPVRDLRVPAGAAESASVWALSEKKPFQETERPKITPGAGEEATAEAAKQALWGPHRMPADYDLICEGGKALQVRALPAEQSGSGIGRAFRSAYRRTVDWYRRWRAQGKTRDQYAIQVWLAEDDSRLLFWSLPKQINILVLAGAVLP